MIPMSGALKLDKKVNNYEKHLYSPYYQWLLK